MIQTQLGVTLILSRALIPMLALVDLTSTQSYTRIALNPIVGYDPESQNSRHDRYESMSSLNTPCWNRTKTIVSTSDAISKNIA